MGHSHPKNGQTIRGDIVSLHGARERRAAEPRVVKRQSVWPEALRNYLREQIGAATTAHDRAAAVRLAARLAVR